MTAEEITEALQTWMEEKTGASIDPDQPYGENDAVDSFDVFELIRFAEANFGVRFAASDLESVSFTTLSGLGRLIRSRIGER